MHFFLYIICLNHVTNYYCQCLFYNIILLSQKEFGLHRFEIVIFKSLRNSKRRNKGNFMSKSNSNKMKLCRGGGRQHYLVLKKISML